MCALPSCMRCVCQWRRERGVSRLWRARPRRACSGSGGVIEAVGDQSWFGSQVASGWNGRMRGSAGDRQPTSETLCGRSIGSVITCSMPSPRRPARSYKASHSCSKEGLMLHRINHVPPASDPAQSEPLGWPAVGRCIVAGLALTAATPPPAPAPHGFLAEVPPPLGLNEMERRLGCTPAVRTKGEGCDLQGRGGGERDENIPLR